MFRSALRRLHHKWKSYRHRFVPWIALNLSKNENTLRQVPNSAEDKLVPDKEVSQALLKLFGLLLRSHWAQNDELRAAQTFFLGGMTTKKDPCEDHPVNGYDAMLQSLGFCIDRKPSSLPSAGTGVFVTKGFVPKGTTVAMYPGTVYQTFEPIFLQSIRNPFVFRCIDGILIDGNDKGISKVVFRSCSNRDRLGPFMMSDSTWLTSRPLNPLAVGQYVNNCNDEWPANVSYKSMTCQTSFLLSSDSIYQM